MKPLENPSVPVEIRQRASEAALVYANTLADADCETHDVRKAHAALTAAVQDLAPLSPHVGRKIFYLSVQAKERKMGPEKVNALKGHAVRRTLADHTHYSDAGAYSAIMASDTNTDTYTLWPHNARLNHGGVRHALRGEYLALLQTVFILYEA